MDITPITPNEVVTIKTQILNPNVIKIWNETIATHWHGNQAKVYQETIILNLLNGIPSLTRAKIFADKLLDIETIYETAGWNVFYDSPAYCESYEAFFVFRKK